MNNELKQKKYLIPLILLSVLAIVLTGALLFNIFGKHDDSDITETTDEIHTSTSPENDSLRRSSTSSNKAISNNNESTKNSGNTNDVKQGTLTGNQAVAIIKDKLGTLPEGYSLASDRVDIKDGKKYHIVKGYYNDAPDKIVSWFFIDQYSKTAYRLDEEDNNLYEIRQANPNIKPAVNYEEEVIHTKE